MQGIVKTEIKDIKTTVINFSSFLLAFYKPDSSDSDLQGAYTTNIPTCLNISAN